MPKKINVTTDDLATFHDAVEGTKPLSQNKIRLSSPVKPRKIKKEINAPETVLHLSTDSNLPEVSSEAFISFKQNDISNKNLRKLRKGQYNVGATLDLHGMNVEEAMVAVESFLQQCMHKGMRVVLIIHGKGYHSGQSPVLKNKLNHWLREINFVLAFSSAAPQHGSRGAMYVLLKKDTSEENLFE